jgi:hypothetical protein
MLMHYANEETEAGVPPSEELIQKMGKLMSEIGNEGILLAGEGVHASRKGARLIYRGGHKNVVDGPFAEAKELIAGFVLIDVPTKQDAINFADRFAEVVGDVQIDVRQVVEPEDLAQGLETGQM